MMTSPRSLLPRLLVIALVTVLVAISPMTPADAQSPSSAVHVVTYLDIAPGQMAKATPLLRQFQADSRKVSGNTSVELYQEIGRPGRIVVRSSWADQKAFAAGGTAAAAAELAAGLKPLQIAPADQRVHLDFASGNGPAKATAAAVHVFTHVDVPPPRQGDLEPMLRQIQAASVKAATSVRYDVLQQSSRKNHFTVVETWTSLKAVDAQAVAAAQREYRDKLGPMLGALYDQRTYKAIR